MSDDDACQGGSRAHSEPRPPIGAARPSRVGNARSRHLRARKPLRTGDQPRHDPKADPKREDSEERALRRIFAQKPMIEARLLEEVARYTRECEKQAASVTGPAPSGYAIADPTPAEQDMVGAGTTNVIDEFLYKLDKEEPEQPQQPQHAQIEEMSRPATAQSARNPQAPARVVGVRGAERLAEQVEEFRAKMANVLRENRRLKETVELKDQKIRKLLDDIERIRKDPNVMHPSILRLRKLGLNTPALADLGDRWAGYVLGRASMAMEVGSFSFRNVFAAHASNGVLTEESFKTVLRQFEPSIKSDQLTRLWYFADEDGSGRIDLFEFMRMAGCNSNGEMTDEYYEVVAMHLYRKFHAKGGVRRVYATADKNWDQHLNLAEFSKFIKVLLKDVQLTRREIAQVFQRMNVSGSGMLSVLELESALEAAGAKCHVSEAWVKDTFHQLATSIQDAGLNIKSLFSTGIVVEKEFREIALRFLTQLRPSQLDRLWKYLQTACADDAMQVRHAGGDKDRLPSDSVLSVIFGPTLTSSPNEISSGAPQGSGSSGSYFGPAGGVGREVLEQLVQHLVRRAGDASPDVCFDSLNPFITSEHFHDLLSTRLGIHYDPVKAKQVFKLIDSDRDSKITRLEFRLMFKAVTPDAQALNTRLENMDDDWEKDAEKHQVSRLQNRVLLLQREVEELRGPSGRGHLEPTVPEKQFQQLSTSHGKVANHLQALRAQLQVVNTRSSGVAVSPTRQGNRRMSDPGGGFGLASVPLGDSTDEHVKEFERTLQEETESFQTQLQALASSNALLRRRLRVLEEAARRRGVSLMSDEEPDSDDAPSPKKPEVVLCEQLLASERKAIEDMPVPTAEELYGDVQLVLAKLQKALLRNPAMKKSHVQEMLKKSGDVVIDGRWKVKTVLSYSKRMVVALCYDLHLGREVVVKMSQTLEASLQLAHVDYVLRMLSAVPIIPEVQYCSSPSSSLPFMVMELLQGSTLKARFQESKAQPMLELEAAEIGYALLMGMDACHQQQVFNLALCPRSIWVGLPLEGSRVRVLDWSISEIGAAVVENPKLHAYINMRKTGLLRGKSGPKLESAGQEVSPSEIAGKRDRKDLQNLVFNGHGSLYYMSMEQLYQTIRSFERPAPSSTMPQSWFQESIGSVVKIEGRTVHWFQKGDGFVQTSQPVTVTPLGQLFEVEIIKAVNLGRKLECELGFCIGFCSKPPRASEKAKPEKQDCWIAGGDASFYLKGAQRRVGKTSADGQPRYLHIASDLRAKDKVAILAEWSGKLSLFVNGEQVGCYGNAIDHSEVVLPLYGVADIFVREASEEYTVRSIGLISEEDSEGCWPVQKEHKEQMERVALELTGIHQLLHGEAAIATTIGPSCDLYACGRILLSLFRGGLELLPSVNLDRFALAYANWAQAGCPPTEKRYGLLWALKELKSEKTERSEELAEVEKGEVKLVLSRCLKRSRYSRLGSCWEAAEMLASASSWLSMSDDFVNSHLDAVRQAKRASLLDSHYTLAQELYEQERRHLSSSALLRADQAVQRAAQCRAEGPSISSRWNLQPYVLGPAHIQRILQVLQEWPDGRFIQAVSLARFHPSVEEELQEGLMSCFSQELEPQNAKQSAKPKRRRALRHSVANIHLGEESKPSLLLEDVRLPTEELPRNLFPLEEILSRNILWLVARLVCKLDLTPAPPGLGQEKSASVGGTPGAMDTLVAGMGRSTVLVSLSLRSSGLRDQAVFQLAAAVARCQTLRELDLSDNNFGAKGAAKVLHAGKDHLEMLDLSRNRLGDVGAKALAEVLLNCHSISVLRLRANGIGEEGGEALAESLMSVTSLREVDFSQNEINVQTSAVMLRATCASRGLQRLRLDSNLPWPTSDSFEVHIAAFTDQLGGLQAVPSLQLLSLRRCGLSTSACKLFESLATNSTLRQLNVACNGLRQGVAPKIVATLTSPSTGLEELDLRDNRLGVQDALAIALEQACPAAPQDANCTMRPRERATSEEFEADPEPPSRGRNNCLRLLNLANNEITAEAISRFTVALPFFHALEELLLYHNPLIGDAGAQALAEMLNPETWPSGKGLKTLSLAACSIGDAGCQSLMAAVRDSQALTSLDLSCNSITDDSTPAVSLVLAHSNSALESLGLSMNLISSYGISQLMDGVARNIEGSLCEIDVSTQEGGQGRTSFVDNDALSPRSSSKVRSKFQGLR